jgi:hypothetical protein
MCSWDTTREDITHFLADLKAITANPPKDVGQPLSR